MNSQYILEAIYTTFSIISTSAIVSKLPTGEDGEVIEPSAFRKVETQDLGPPKFQGIEDSSCKQEDGNQRQDQTKKELTLVALKAA